LGICYRTTRYYELVSQLCIWIVTIVFFNQWNWKRSRCGQQSKSWWCYWWITSFW